MDETIMRWREIREALDLNYQTSLPDGNIYPDISSKYYFMYRFGIAAASHPDPDHKTNKTSEVGNNLFTLQYTDADREILKGAAKEMGIKSKSVASGGSKELSDTNTTSPVSNWRTKK